MLHYHFALVKSKETVLELINPEMGPAGVEGDELGLATSSAAASRGKRKRMPNPELKVLMDCSASMAASAARHARMAELVALSTTLKNAQDAHLPAELIATIRAQFDEAVRAPTALEPGQALDRQSPSASGGDRALADLEEPASRQVGDGRTAGRGPPRGTHEASPDVEGTALDDQATDGEEPS